MSPMPLNPFFWFALLLAGWGAWRLTGWLASGCRLPLRRRRGTASGFANAGLAAQVFYQPNAQQAIEMTLGEEARREDDDEGDPPEPGAEPHDSERAATSGR
jgi:hypothetical protein